MSVQKEHVVLQLLELTSDHFLWTVMYHSIYLMSDLGICFTCGCTQACANRGLHI